MCSTSIWDFQSTFHKHSLIKPHHLWQEYESLHSTLKFSHLLVLKSVPVIHKGLGKKWRGLLHTVETARGICFMYWVPGNNTRWLHVSKINRLLVRRTIYRDTAAGFLAMHTQTDFLILRNNINNSFQNWNETLVHP